MRADVHAREGDQAGEREQGEPRQRRQPREDRGAREARRGVAGGQGRVARDGQEWRRLRIDDMWAIAVDHATKDVRGSVGDDRRGQHPGEDRRLSPRERGQRAEQHPDPADPTDLGERDERLVEQFGAVLDDPALEPGVELGQVGRSCFVDSISCCGLKGLPMKP